MIVTISAAFLWSSAPSAEAEQSLAEQFSAADAMMQGTATDAGSYYSSYATRLMAGLDGTWTTIGLLNYTNDNPDLLAKACQRQPIRVTVDGQFSIKLTYYLGATRKFTSTFTSNGGNLFGESTPPGRLLHRLGLDQEEAPMDASLRAISNANGTATILRPSPDILIIQTNYGYPSVLGRCSVS